MGKVFFVFILSVFTLIFALPQMLDGGFARSVEGGVKTHSATTAVESAKTSTLMTSRIALKGNSTGDAEIDGYIVASSAHYNIDPLLIYAQMAQESNFKEKATSYKGACGLMQLMPDTAKRFGVTDIYDRQQNIDAGVKYMRWLLNKFDGDVRLALAGYNAGEGAVMKYDNQIPPYRETQNYVILITSRYSQMRNQN